jgi:hypothetical protein
MSLNASFVETVHVTFGRNETWTNTSLEKDVGLAVSLPATDTILVPAGSFETFVIRERWPDGSGQRFDYAPRAGNNARTETFNGTGGEVARTELVSYRYRAGQPPDPLGTWLLLAGVAAIAVIVPTGWLVLRRRRREREYTPPSIREPPT